MEVFVVRLWTPSDEAPEGAESVRGTALHVPSGQTVVFSEPEMLLDFLTLRAEQARRPAGLPGPPAQVGDA